MAQTIDAKFVATETGTSTEVNVPWWNRVCNMVSDGVDVVTDTSKKAYESTVKLVDETVIPAVNSAASSTCEWVDEKAGIAVKAETEFFIKYPNIIMLLCPVTVIKVSVAQFTKDRVSSPSNTNPLDSTDSVVNVD